MSETDYTLLKQDLIDFLRSKSDFTDYNFEGSALSTLIDILAYNGQNLALQSNLSFSETFLDSANQRSSVVSRAKELGYVPTSSTCAKANITVSFSVSGNPTQYTLPKNTKFVATNSSNSYQFITTEDRLIDNVSNVFTDTFDIVQGKLTSYQYTVNLLDLNQKYIIPSKTVDLDYLAVEVNSIPYTNYVSHNIGEIDGSSNIFYLFENIDGYYEIYFGDDILGKAIENGDVISITYLITSESDPNDLNRFTLNQTLSGVSNFTIVTNDPAVGGSERESVQSIKFNAPLSYQKQNRAVSKYDYKNLILENVSDVDDVNVWGGEDNDPPYYGKVFIALKPSGGKYISNFYKERIKSLIKANYSIVTIRPEIVDGDFTDVGVDCTVSYSGKTYNPLTDTTLNSDIEQAIIDFFADNGNKFGETIYHSGLIQTILSSNDLVLNTIVNFTLTKYNKVYFGISGNYTYNFNNYIAPETVRSSGFIINGTTWYIKDVPSGSYPYTTGTLVVYNTSGSTTTYYSQNVGTVDYTTGEVSIENLSIDNLLTSTATELSITVNQGSFIDQDTVFSDYNIYTNGRDQLIRLLEDQITITLLPDNTR